MNRGFIIFDFMATDLKLSGNELIVYAIVYNATQGGVTKYTDGPAYIKTYLNISRQNINAYLNKLVEKKLIAKDTISMGGLKYCAYAVNLDIFNCRPVVPQQTSGLPADHSLARVPDNNSISRQSNIQTANSTSNQTSNINNCIPTNKLYNFTFLTKSIVQSVPDAAKKSESISKEDSAKMQPLPVFSNKNFSNNNKNSFLNASAQEAADITEDDIDNYHDDPFEHLGEYDEDSKREVERNAKIRGYKLKSFSTIKASQRNNAWPHDVYIAVRDWVSALIDRRGGIRADTVNNIINEINLYIKSTSNSELLNIIAKATERNIDTIKKTKNVMYYDAHPEKRNQAKVKEPEKRKPKPKMQLAPEKIEFTAKVGKCSQDDISYSSELCWKHCNNKSTDEEEKYFISYLPDERNILRNKYFSKRKELGFDDWTIYIEEKLKERIDEKCKEYEEFLKRITK